MGCIRIDDNVFVGANTTILADVHIESYVIVGAGTLVNKDLEGGYVYAGVPAKKVGTFEEFVAKREAMISHPETMIRNGDSVPSQFADWMWKQFQRKHNI